MLSVFALITFYPEVVHYEDKLDRVDVVMEEIRYMVIFVVTVFGEMCFESLL